MPRYLTLVLLLASVTVHAATSLRVDNQVLTIGDSAVRLQELMGQPTIRAPQPQQNDGQPENRPAPREQWQYAQDGQTIVITIVGGRATKFETLYP
jgi:hypothetical protein